MKKTKLFLISLFAVVFFLVFAQVVLSNSFSTTGIEMVKIEQEMDKYKKENAILQEKFLTASSLTRIASSASLLGFSEKKSRVFLTDLLPLAIKR